MMKDSALPSQTAAFSGISTAIFGTVAAADKHRHGTTVMEELLDILEYHQLSQLVLVIVLVSGPFSFYGRRAS